MKVLIAYYSKTGKTKKVCEILAEELRGRGEEVELFKLEPKKEYSFPLLNPRAYKETLSGKCELKREPEGEYDLVIFASPIWYDHVTAPVMEGARRLKGKVRKAVAITTSARSKNYHEMFSKELQSLGYEVIGSYGFLKVEEEKVKKIADEISSRT